MKIKRFVKWTLSLGLMVLGISTIGIKSDASEGTYYSSITNTTDGETLMSSLYTLIGTGTTDVGYNGLWNAYKTTDVKSNGKIWDMYSNTDYTPGDDQAGTSTKSGSTEGDCYNREHTVPQSWFNEASPMKADLYHVYPTDTKVNGVRSNYLYGEVDTTQTISYTSNNGSMLGVSKYTIDGYSDKVFEPIDEYKGDFARGYFYMATRYMDKVGSWTSDATCVFKGSYPYLTSYAIELFVKWSNEDPVSDKETARCDAVYSLQGNRNPFIDHPEWINTIWGASYTGAYADSSSTDTEVTNVINLINALPSTITLDNETAVNEANTAYQALTTTQQGNVTNYSKLQSALATIASLKSSSETVTMSSFTATSGDLNSYISYSTDKGDSSTNPAIYDNEIRLYQNSNGTGGGTITITASDSKYISSVTIGSSMATSVAYTLAEDTTKTKSETSSISKGGTYTVDKIKTSAITFYCMGNSTTSRLYVNYLSVTYATDDGNSGTANDSLFESQNTKSSMRFHYSSTESEEYYELLKDDSELKVGSEFIIVSATDNSIGMGEFNSSNYKQATVSVSNNKITDVSGLTVLTIDSIDSNGILIKSGSVYLANTNKTSNGLKTTSNKLYWTISIDSSGVATIKMADSNYTKNIIRYNSTSSLFSCYASGQNDVAIYIKSGGSIHNYSDVKLQYGGCLSKDLYEALVKEGTTVNFGVSLSLDGTSYTDYACTPVYVSAFGDTVENTSGSYVQYFAVIPVSEANYDKTVYAKCYVSIDGVKHYMNEASYSINSLAEYYYSNAASLGITDDTLLSAVKGLVA